jgi:hypothetical protein
MIIRLLFFISPLMAAIGCLDDRSHMQHERYYESVDPSLRAGMRTYRDEEGSRPFFTGWRQVACTCPCNQYHAGYLTRTNGSYGYCVKCGHRGAVGRRNHIEVPTDDVKLKAAWANRLRRSRHELPEVFSRVFKQN